MSNKDFYKKWKAANSEAEYWRQHYFDARRYQKKANLCFIASAVFALFSVIAFLA